MSKRLTLQDLVDILAESKGVTKKDAEAFVRELFAVISENIEKKDSVRIKDFGTFKLIKVNSRKSVDVNTGEDIEIPAHYKLGFTPDKSLRDRINAPFAHFETTLLKDGVNLEDTEVFDEALDALNEDEPDDVVEITQKQEVVEATEIKTEAVQEEVPVSETRVEDVVEIESIEKADESDVENEVAVEDIKEEEIIEVAEEQSTENVEVLEPSRSVNEQMSPQLVDEFENEDSNEEEHGSRSLIWILIACFVLLLLGGIYIFKDQIFGKGILSEKESSLAVGTTDENVLLADTTINPVVAIDSLSNTTDSISDSSFAGEVETLQPLDTIQIEYGDTMRKLGLKYYGNRSFWVYIYLENSDKIENFNNVPLGTSLVIPAAEKYGIDANDKESLARARKLEGEYLSR